MKVAFISQPSDRVVPPVEHSSLPIWIYEVARRLAQHCNVTVFGRGRAFRKSVEHHCGVRYHHMPVALDKYIINRMLRVLRRVPGFRSNAHPLFASRWFYLGYILQVARHLKAQQCDVAHLHNYSQFVPIIRALNPTIRIVLHMHCEWLTQLDAGMVTRRLQPVDSIVGCSEYITKTICLGLPTVAARCSTVFNGVDVDYFCPQTTDQRTKQRGATQLLFVGRISPEKGVHVLLDAFQRVLERDPGAELTLVGPEGSLPAEFLVGLATQKNIQDLARFYVGSYISHLRNRLPATVARRVSFAGFVPHSALVNVYRRADILINPSFSEAFGMTLIEAMATGIPVIATRVGGMTELVEDGKTGLLVEPGDADALAQAMITLMGNEGLRREMGEAGRRRAVSFFGWDAVVDQLVRQYERIYKTLPGDRSQRW